jgi:hypothetical protein
VAWRRGRSAGLLLVRARRPVVPHHHDSGARRCGKDRDHALRMYVSTAGRGGRRGMP